jgi:putative FmdB family regulatory protein
MPTYEYRCKTCGKTHEIQHGFNDERPTKCPACGGVLVRIFHPVGVVFKGSGFHKTDYSGSGAKAPAGERGSEKKPDSGSESKVAESKATETKQETTSAAKPDAKPASPPAPKPDSKTGGT